MGCRKLPGLYKRHGQWIIDKRIFGRRLYESTGTSDLEEAQSYLARRIEEIRQARIFGVRPKRIFRQAATKYIEDNQHKKQAAKNAPLLKYLDKFIGDLPIEFVHMGTLRPYIDARCRDGVKSRTINHGLKAVRHILNLASGEWLDENGLNWLQSPPKIKLLPEHDLREPYPITWGEQEKLFNKLPEHLRLMALFAVNTGTRDSVTCGLRWEWEIPLPELDVSVFFVPKELMKSRRDHIIILNDDANEVIEEVRGKHPEYVFTYRGKRIHHMLNNGWRKARKEAGMPFIRVHDLRHTCGSRLRAAGVSVEDREDILAHKSDRMTTHYSAAEIENLIVAANKICRRDGQTPALTVLRRNDMASLYHQRQQAAVEDKSRKSPARGRVTKAVNA